MWRKGKIFGLVVNLMVKNQDLEDNLIEEVWHSEVNRMKKDHNQNLWNESQERPKSNLEKDIREVKEAK